MFRYRMVSSPNDGDMMIVYDDLHLDHVSFTIYLAIPLTGTVVAFEGTIM